MIKCKNCGADMRYDIKNQKLLCDYCDSTVDVINVHKTDITSEEQVMEGIIHTCPQCGAQLFTTEETAATFCSYCGSSVLLESRLVSINKPDFIIPFQISKDRAEKEYKRKLAGAVFAPSSLKKAEIASIRGIYMPYWEYYLKNINTTRLRVQKYSHRAGDYVYYDNYDISFQNHIESDGLEFDASSRFPDDLSQACAPYYFRESKLFNPGYISGFYADLGDVDPYTYSMEANDIVSRFAAEEIMQNSDLSRQGITRKQLENRLTGAEVNAGLALYPVWFTCARDSSGQNINYGVVNGQTGKVAADLPVDMKKVLIGSLIFAIPIFLLLYFLFTPNPISTVVIIAILSVIGSYTGIKKVDDIGVDDKGAKVFRSRPTAAQKKERKAEKTRIRLRLIASLVICAAVIIINPALDYFFYGAAIAAGVLCGWNYFRLFQLHNKSTLRPLPQLDKRGGDVS